VNDSFLELMMACRQVEQNRMARVQHALIDADYRYVRAKVRVSGDAARHDFGQEEFHCRRDAQVKIRLQDFAVVALVATLRGDMLLEVMRRLLEDSMVRGVHQDMFQAI
jgi:hypothetical protein